MDNIPENEHKEKHTVPDISEQKEQGRGRIPAKQYTDRYYVQSGNAELITYDTQSGRFSYSDVVKELFNIRDDNVLLWEHLGKNDYASAETAAAMCEDITKMLSSDMKSISLAQYFLKSTDGMWRWYRMCFTPTPEKRYLIIVLIDINEEILSNRKLRRMADYDELTGLLTRPSFESFAEDILRHDPDGAASGDYAIVFMDIVRFKVINDLFGQSEGDKLLIYIANVLLGICGSTDNACRINADRFAIFLNTKENKLHRLIDVYFTALAEYYLAFEIVSNLGIYVTDGEKLTVSAMLDRARLVQSTIKGSYVTKYSYYNESLRNEVLGEQEIVGAMNSALHNEQFIVYYQPQYDVSSNTIVGAEALVRWMHPERGLLMPASFIPIFEKNGFITKLDLYVFEHTCRFLRKCIDSGTMTIPISVNFTRYDIFQHNFIENLEEIRQKYDIPVGLVRIEITETAAMGSVKHITEIINKLHKIGYIVEMDDFGSGYSSLNVLKDINIDYLKLDMSFLADDIGNNRSGIILSSVVRMVRWLDLPVIAEGVKSINQADFLRSIGCNYVQGFLYAKPMHEEKFVPLLNNSKSSSDITHFNFIDTMNARDFWDPESLDSLIFNQFVGPAAIFDYDEIRIDVFRVNQKYLDELNGAVTEKELIDFDGMEALLPEERTAYVNMLDRAIASGQEESCECWRCYTDNEDDSICIRSTVRLLGKSEKRYLFFESIRNVTMEKKTQTAENKSSPQRKLKE